MSPRVPVVVLLLLSATGAWIGFAPWIADLWVATPISIASSLASLRGGRTSSLARGALIVELLVYARVCAQDRVGFMPLGIGLLISCAAASAILALWNGERADRAWMMLGTATAAIVHAAWWLALGHTSWKAAAATTAGAFVGALLVTKLEARRDAQ